MIMISKPQEELYFIYGRRVSPDRWKKKFDFYRTSKRIIETKHENSYDKRGRIVTKWTYKINDEEEV